MPEEEEVAIIAARRYADTVEVSRSPYQGLQCPDKDRYLAATILFDQ